MEGLDRTEKEIERAVIGSLLRWPDSADEVIPILSEEDFADSAHQIIYLAVMECREKGCIADLATVANVLHVRDQLKNIGPKAHAVLGELWECAESSYTVAQHARIVRDMSLCRQLAVAGHQIAGDAEKRVGPAADMLEAAESRIFDLGEAGMLSEAVSMQVIIGRALDRIDSWMSRKVMGVSTGFSAIDELTGGCHHSELTVIAARPSVGKTALAIQIALHASQHGTAVYFASLEQAGEELGTRMMCMEGGVDSQLIRTGRITSELTGRLHMAADPLRRQPIYIDDHHTQSIHHLAAMARRLKRKKGIGLVIVDYLQLVDPEDKKANRHEQVTAIARRLKAMAREIKAPVIALAQLNREVEQGGRRKPRLSDLRESGGIEAAADTVLLMYRVKDDETPAERELIGIIVGKQRNGPTGEIALEFHRRHTKFAPPAYTPFERNGAH